MKSNEAKGQNITPITMVPTILGKNLNRVEDSVHDQILSNYLGKQENGSEVTNAQKSNNLAENAFKETSIAMKRSLKALSKTVSRGNEQTYM